MTSFTLLPIDPRAAGLAARIHAVQLAAYRQEAALLGVTHFPPLDRTVADIAASTDTCIGAFDGDALLGVVGVEQRGGRDALIASLTVRPDAQRRGIGRALVVAVAMQWLSQQLRVSTGAKNAPALALYRQLGFEERSRRLAGSEAIEVVELVAPAGRVCRRGEPARIGHAGDPAP